jgi:hypothetical protein
MKPPTVVPIACIALLLAAVLVNTARAKTDQTFDGVVVQTLNKYEFYPDATSCSLTGTPYILVPNADFDREVRYSADAEHLERLFHVGWKVKLKGNLSRFGVYGLETGLKSGYWRELDVSRVDDVKLLGCFVKPESGTSPSSPPPTESTDEITVSSDGPNRLIKAPGLEGVIFPGTPTGSRMEKDIYPKGATFWSPTQSDIIAAEAMLVPFLQASKNPDAPKIAAKLGTYKRQYRGVVVGGKKRIFIRFFCTTSAPDEVMKEETYIFDGGSCFFNVTFTPATSTFSDLMINGEA